DHGGRPAGGRRAAGHHARGPRPARSRPRGGGPLLQAQRRLDGAAGGVAFPGGAVEPVKRLSPLLLLLCACAGSFVDNTGVPLTPPDAGGGTPTCADTCTSA